MRRGVGLVDVFLSVFLLFLILFALLLTGLPIFKPSTVQISDVSGYQLIRASITERSLLESFPLTFVEGDVPIQPTGTESFEFEDYVVSRSESLSMIATYKDSDVVGTLPGRRLFSPLAIESNLMKNNIHFSVLVSEHDRIGATVPRMLTPPEMNFWIDDEGSLMFRAGVQRDKQYSESRLVRVPGFIGPDVHARSIFVRFEMPAEVKQRES